MGRMNLCVDRVVIGDSKGKRPQPERLAKAVHDGTALSKGVPVGGRRPAAAPSRGKCAAAGRTPRHSQIRAPPCSQERRGNTGRPRQADRDDHTPRRSRLPDTVCPPGRACSARQTHCSMPDRGPLDTARPPGAHLLGEAEVDDLDVHGAHHDHDCRPGLSVAGRPSHGWAARAEARTGCGCAWGKGGGGT